MKRHKQRTKISKKLILVAATVLVVGGAGTGVALAMQDEPKKVVEQSTSVTLQKVADPVESPPAVFEEPTVEEEVPVEPVETVESVLNAQGWNELASGCMDTVVAQKADYFKDVETTKKTVAAIKSIPFTSPCVLVMGTGGVDTGNVLPTYWQMVERNIDLQ